MVPPTGDKAVGDGEGVGAGELVAVGDGVVGGEDAGAGVLVAGIGLGEAVAWEFLSRRPKPTMSAAMSTAATPPA